MGGVQSLFRRAHLFILLQLCVVDLPDLGQLGPVVRVLCRVVHPRSSRGCRRSCCRCRASTFLWTGHTLRQQHVVQPHELGIRRLLLLGAADTQHWNDRSGSEVSHKGRTYSGMMHRNKLSAAGAWAAASRPPVQCEGCNMVWDAQAGTDGVMCVDSWTLQHQRTETLCSVTMFWHEGNSRQILRWHKLQKFSLTPCLMWMCLCLLHAAFSVLTLQLQDWEKYSDHWED